MRFLILFFMSSVAMADCAQMISKSDFQTMKAGGSLPIVKVCKVNCLCSPLPVNSESVKMLKLDSGGNNIVFDEQNKAEHDAIEAEKATAKQAKRDKVSSIAVKIKARSAKLEEILEYIELRDNL